MPTIANYGHLLEFAASLGPVPVAIAAAQEEEVIIAALEAQRRGIAAPILVGDETEIVHLARQQGIDPQRLHIVSEPDPEAAANRTMRIAASGQARVAVKGQIETSKFLKAALDRENGLRTERLISHVGIFEVPGFDRLLFITDGGVVLYPTLQQKVEIISNAIEVARKVGIEWPRVALLAAADTVLPNVPLTVEIAGIVAMRERWARENAYVDGPLLLDSAVSPEIAKARGLSGPVAGQADVLVGPNVESVNIMAKGITYFAGGMMAGVVVGAKAPLVVGSRADPPQTRLVCIAAGALIAGKV